MACGEHQAMFHSHRSPPMRKPALGKGLSANISSKKLSPFRAFRIKWAFSQESLNSACGLQTHIKKKNQLTAIHACLIGLHSRLLLVSMQNLYCDWNKVQKGLISVQAYWFMRLGHMFFNGWWFRNCLQQSISFFFEKKTLTVVNNYGN